MTSRLRSRLARIELQFIQYTKKIELIPIPFESQARFDQAVDAFVAQFTRVLEDALKPITPPNTISNAIKETAIHHLAPFASLFVALHTLFKCSDALAYQRVRDLLDEPFINQLANWANTNADVKIIECFQRCAIACSTEVWNKFVTPRISASISMIAEHVYMDDNHTADTEPQEQDRLKQRHDRANRVRTFLHENWYDRIKQLQHKADAYHVWIVQIEAKLDSRKDGIPAPCALKQFMIELGRHLSRPYTLPDTTAPTIQTSPYSWNSVVDMVSSVFSNPIMLLPPPLSHALPATVENIDTRKQPLVLLAKSIIHTIHMNMDALLEACEVTMSRIRMKTARPMQHPAIAIDTPSSQQAAFDIVYDPMSKMGVSEEVIYSLSNWLAQNAKDDEMACIESTDMLIQHYSNHQTRQQQQSTFVPWRDPLTLDEIARMHDTVRFPGANFSSRDKIPVLSYLTGKQATLPLVWYTLEQVQRANIEWQSENLMRFELCARTLSTISSTLLNMLRSNIGNDNNSAFKSTEAPNRIDDVNLPFNECLSGIRMTSSTPHIIVDPAIARIEFPYYMFVIRELVQYVRDAFNRYFAPLSCGNVKLDALDRTMAARFNEIVAELLPAIRSLDSIPLAPQSFTATNTQAHERVMRIQTIAETSTTLLRKYIEFNMATLTENVRSFVEHATTNVTRHVERNAAATAPNMPKLVGVKILDEHGIEITGENQSNAINRGICKSWLAYIGTTYQRICSTLEAINDANAGTDESNESDFIDRANDLVAGTIVAIQQGRLANGISSLTRVARQFGHIENHNPKGSTWHTTRAIIMAGVLRVVSQTILYQYAVMNIGHALSNSAFINAFNWYIKYAIVGLPDAVDQLLKSVFDIPKFGLGILSWTVGRLLIVVLADWAIWMFGKWIESKFDDDIRNEQPWYGYPIRGLGIALKTYAAFHGSMYTMYYLLGSVLPLGLENTLPGSVFNTSGSVLQYNSTNGLGGINYSLNTAKFVETVASFGNKWIATFANVAERNPVVTWLFHGFSAVAGTTILTSLGLPTWAAGIGGLVSPSIVMYSRNEAMWKAIVSVWCLVEVALTAITFTHAQDPVSRWGESTRPLLQAMISVIPNFTQRMGLPAPLHQSFKEMIDKVGTLALGDLNNLKKSWEDRNFKLLTLDGEKKIEETEKKNLPKAKSGIDAWNQFKPRLATIYNEQYGQHNPPPRQINPKEIFSTVFKTKPW